MLKNFRTKHMLALAVALLVIAAAGFVVYKQKSFQKPASTVPAAPPAGSISAAGVLLCLPHKDTSGPQTMECAYGLKDIEGRFFALQDSDPGYKNISGVPMNEQVEVAGTFTPQESSKYQSVGVIRITSLTLANRKKAQPQTTSFTWNFAELGLGANSGAPETKVTLTANGRQYNAGTHSGSCFVIEQSAWSLLLNEKSGALCWFAGGGVELGVFEENGTLLLKQGEADEGTAETPGIRGNFQVLNEIE